jgi:hypothetical protein
LDISRTHSGLFRQLFLGQMPALAHGGHVFAKSCSRRAVLGFARRHCQIVAQRRLFKHEALHRALVPLRLYNLLPVWKVNHGWRTLQNVTILLLVFG